MAKEDQEGRVGDTLRDNNFEDVSAIPNDVFFADSYVLGDEINAGSFGVVYFTHHVTSEDKEQYAVKIIERDDEGSAEIEAIHESRIMHLLKGVPNVIQLQDFYMDGESLYIVQDLAMGGDVFDRLAKRETYTEKDARGLSIMLLKTVGNIHRRQIVHRDLKPENLLLQTKEDDSTILLCDFGLAKELPEDKEEGFTTMCGTPAYTAPEIIAGEDQYRENVDLWAVGVIIYALLGGSLPFGDDSDPDLFDRIEDGDYDYDDESWDFVSGSAKKVITNLLKHNPKKRWTVTDTLQSKWCKKDPNELKGIKLQKSLKGIRRMVMRRKLKAAAKCVSLSTNLCASFAKRPQPQKGKSIESILE